MTTREVFEKLLKNNRTSVIIYDLELRQVSYFLDGYCCAIEVVELFADNLTVAMMLTTVFKYIQVIDKNIERKERRMKLFNELKTKLENN